MIVSAFFAFTMCVCVSYCVCYGPDWQLSAVRSRVADDVYKTNF